VPRADAALVPALGLAGGDRCLYLGIGQRHGKQADVLAVRREFASIRFDSGIAVLCLARDCHPVPRRPPAMW